MRAGLGLQGAMKEKPVQGNSETETRPCMNCQYGIWDTPVYGKMNCLQAGTSNIKHLTREEVEEMTSCDKMVHWVRMKFDHEEAKDSEIELVEKFLGNR